MPAADVLPEPPGHLIDRLRRHGFREVESIHDREVFGNVLRVFERPPIKVRIVRDRGAWSAEFTATGWKTKQLGDEWVFLPQMISNDS